MNDTLMHPDCQGFFDFSPSVITSASDMAVKDFAGLLRQQRRQAHLSQEALARKCGVTQSYLNRLETSAITPPGRELCRRIADVLHADFVELWKCAFVSRTRRWLLREGYKTVDARKLIDLFNSVEGDESR
jgi:transcriptional regulator with XRE-family HTH domain